MASMARLMLVTANSLTPPNGRQLATEGTCPPMKTPVGLLRNACRSQPVRSMVSQAHDNVIRNCGSVAIISLCDMPKRLRSKSLSSSPRINPSKELATLPGPEEPPIGRYPLP